VPPRNSRDKLVEEFPSLPRSGAERFAAHAQRLQAGAGGVSHPKNVRSWEKCTADDFRDYLFALDEERPGALYIRLQFSAFRTFYRFLVNERSCRSIRSGTATAESGKEIAAVLTQKQIEELLTAPLACRRKSRADVDAVARRRDPGAFLQQRFAAGRTRFAQRCRPRHLHRIGSHSRQRTKERVCPVGLPALEAVSRYRAAAKCKAVRSSSTNRAAGFAALNLADLETLLRHTSIPISVSPHKLRHSFATPPAR